MSFCWTIFQLAIVRTHFLTLFRNGGGGKKAPYQFFPVTSTNVRISPQNVLTLTFNPFAILVQNFKVIPNASPKLWNLNQDHLSKKVVFRSKPSKIEVMVTSVIEMLDSNFGYVTTSTM